MSVYNVSSAFIDKAQENAVDIARKFTIGSSDYTAYVMSWPKIKRGWNEIKPQSASIKLSNADQAFNFFKTSPINLTASCKVEMGINFTTSSQELYQVFAGTVGRVNYTGRAGDMVTINIIDKMKTFSERVIGDDDNPVDFTTSNYLPSDIAWIACTCYGGLSSVTSTSNPDIDYAAFSKWAEVFSSNTVTVQAYFEGQKVTEVLRKIGRITNTSITEENGLINFSRFDVDSTAPVSVASGAINGVSLAIADEKIINRKIVNAAYNVNSTTYGVTITEANTTSVNSFGIHEEVEKDDRIWYVNSISAINYAQRLINTQSEPYEEIKIKTGLQLMARQVGETLTIYNPILGVSGDTYRLMSYELDMEKGTFSAGVDASQIITYFTLDDATYGLLDGSNNPLG